MAEVIDCEEFGEIRLRVGSLLRDGELTIDERIASKGYLATAFTGGQIVLKATKFVGTIPLTSDISVRVRPRASIANLSYMLVRSRKAPTAISGFSRGYMPRFVSADDVEKIYGRALVDGLRTVSRRGFMKAYVRPANPAPWRGRFLASETIRRHAAKGVRYRHEFDQTVLSVSTTENIALKEALAKVRDWYADNDRRNLILGEINTLLHELWPVRDWTEATSRLVATVARRLSASSQLRSDYVDPLWAAFTILQGTLPEVAAEGAVRLDSLIVNVSEVYEAFVRRELTDRLARAGYRVEDGALRPSPFFATGGPYSVHPDMVIRQDGAVVALLDAKYKPDVKESDRYEVLSFMDAMGVDVGGFVCPSTGRDTSTFMGVTSSGKRLTSLRYDLAAEDPVVEADRFAENVLRMIARRQDFV